MDVHKTWDDFIGYVKQLDVINFQLTHYTFMYSGRGWLIRRATGPSELVKVKYQMHNILCYGNLP